MISACTKTIEYIVQKVQASRGNRKRWDEDFTLSVYNNIVDARRKSKIDKFIEGQIVRMSITWKYQDVGSMWCIIKLKLYQKNIQNEIFQLKGKNNFMQSNSYYKWNE